MSLFTENVTDAFSPPPMMGVDAIIQCVHKGVLDIAVVYRPEYLPGLKIELLLEEKLIMVSAASSDPYIYVFGGRCMHNNMILRFLGSNVQNCRLILDC